MSAVPVHQALFWPADSPVSRSGEVDFAMLAEGMSRADYRGGRGGPLGIDARSTLNGRRQTLEGRRPIAARRPYSCAQHAVVVSRAVETLAVLNMGQRRALAMQAWLAEVRDAELRGATAGAVDARKRLGLRSLELEALADVLARTLPWDGRRSAGRLSRAAAVDRLLTHLAGLDADDRTRLALHGLFSELPPAGLGVAAADAALRAAGLDGEAPRPWVEILRFVRRMAGESVRRDIPAGAGIERTGFPALAVKIEPMAPEAAARFWLERYRVLEAGATAGARASAGQQDTNRGGPG